MLSDFSGGGRGSERTEEVEAIPELMLGITCHISSLESLYRKRLLLDTNFLGPSEENAGYVESTWTKLKPFLNLSWG